MQMAWLLVLAAVAGAAAVYAIDLLRAARASADLPPQTRKHLRRFRAAIDHCPDSVYLVDRDTLKFLDASATAISRTGYSYAELMQMGPQDLLIDTPANLAKAYDEVIAAGTRGIRTEAKGVLKDGRQTYVELNRHAMLCDGKRIIVSVSRDITERKQAEFVAQRAARLFAALAATNEAIMRVADAAKLYQRICEAVVEGGKLLAAAVFVTEEAVRARVAAAAGLEAKWFRELEVSLDGQHPEGGGLVASAFRSQATSVSNDYLTDPRTHAWHASARDAGIASGAAIPLAREGESFGVLLLYSAEAGAFDAETVSLLEHIGRNVTHALENKKHEAERALAHDERRLAQARLDRAIRGSNDGLFELDVSSRAVWVSPRLADMLGSTAHAFDERAELLFEVLHPDSALTFREALEHCIHNRAPVDKEVRAMNAAREWRWYRVRAALELDADGRPMTVSGSMRDVTEVRHYRKALLEATESAASANRAKSEFLANMSHEIRTPMNGVIGMVELLLETPLNAMQKDYVETVRDSAGSLLTVINDILDFSKVEAGKLELECLDMDLRDTMEDVARMLSIQAHAKGLEVSALIDPKLPDLVRGDAGRLRQVLLNLGGNAVKFTQAGEVALECRVLEVSESGLAVRCEVRDTGVGIPAARLPSLFNAFTQVDSSTTRRFGGTGLGLSIVKRLVELMGGEVSVASQEGFGSTFSFTVRLGTAENQAQAAAVPPAELRGQRVIVVDDNITNRKVLLGQLSLCGMDPAAASSAEEALDLMRKAVAAGRPFEVALIDFQMPGIDGANLGAAVQGDRELSATRLVLLTSSGQRGDGKRFSELGFAGYLLKPVTHRDLTDCLMMVLGVRAETWSLRSQPIVTRHALRSQRSRDARHILVAEDNLVNQKVACRILEKLGYRVDVAGDGAAALSAWQSGRYDLILMDCQMPVMDGYETTRKIRECEGTGAHIPIVALTAHAIKGADNECFAAGMDDYLSKPIDREQLRTTLERWLNEDLAAQAAEV
ncbi:MAG TPA: response regulator [Steroidobacteraceae bacterium]